MAIEDSAPTTTTPKTIKTHSSSQNFWPKRRSMSLPDQPTTTIWHPSSQSVHWKKMCFLSIVWRNYSIHRRFYGENIVNLIYYKNGWYGNCMVTVWRANNTFYRDFILKLAGRSSKVFMEKTC